MSSPEKIESPEDPATDLELTPSKAPSRFELVKRHFEQSVETRAAYIPLLICCFVTGLTDGTIYNAYGTFVSMQTGNTIFVALGTSGQNNKPFGWAYSLCSIGCFAAGSVAFARAHQLAGGGRLRRTVALSFLTQTVLLAAAAALVQGGVVDGTYQARTTTRGAAVAATATATGVRPDFTDLAMVALLSFQAAGQIVNSRGLGVGEVPTVVITSLLCDLLGDPALLARANGKRDRRAAAFVLTLVGAIAGGWLSKAIGAVQPALWLAAAIKAVITVYWLGLLQFVRRK